MNTKNWKWLLQALGLSLCVVCGAALLGCDDSDDDGTGDSDSDTDSDTDTDTDSDSDTDTDTDTDSDADTDSDTDSDSDTDTDADSDPDGVIDFDDYEGALAQIPEGYGGIANWGAFSYSSTTDDPPYVPYSGTTYALMVGANSSMIDFGTEYVFEGAYFAGFDNITINYELYLNEELVHSTSPVNLTLKHAFWPSDYDGAVDKVNIISTVNMWVMDDFTISAVK